MFKTLVWWTTIKQANADNTLGREQRLARLGTAALETLLDIPTENLIIRGEDFTPVQAEKITDLQGFVQSRKFTVKNEL